MFGISLTKILFTLFVFAAVWYGYAWMTRVQARRRADIEARMRKEVDTGPASNRHSGDAGTSVRDLEPCPVCGAFVPLQEARSCGRADCPYRG